MRGLIVGCAGSRVIEEVEGGCVGQADTAAAAVAGLRAQLAVVQRQQTQPTQRQSLSGGQVGYTNVAGLERPRGTNSMVTGELGRYYRGQMMPADGRRFQGIGHRQHPVQRHGGVLDQTQGGVIPQLSPPDLGNNGLGRIVRCQAQLWYGAGFRRKNGSHTSKER
jgi:hypothetical protein